MFGTVLLLVCTLMHVYVFLRSATVPSVVRHVRRSVLLAAGVALWTLFFLGRVVGHGGTGTAAGTLEFLGMTWMAVLFLLFAPLLTVDLATLFGLLLPKQAPSLRGWALIAGGALSATAALQGLRPPVVGEYQVALDGLPAEMDGTVVVALSDLHLGSQLGERWLSDRIAQVEAERPDLVLLLGDIFEGHGPPRKELVSALQRLSAPLGVWAVPGNHESHRRQQDAGLPDETGFQVLRNRWVRIRPGFVLAGVEDLTAQKRSGRSGDFISQALSGRPPGATLLLSHTPWQAEKAARAGVGLMLCGHTHGGQIWPFGYLVRLSYPLLEGRYEVEGMPVIVCRGTGTWGPRMRLWRPGEILRVELRAKERVTRADCPYSAHGSPGLVHVEHTRDAPVLKAGFAPDPSNYGAAPSAGEARKEAGGVRFPF